MSIKNPVSAKNTYFEILVGTLNFPILIKIPIFVGQGFDITDFQFEAILFKRKIYLKASFCQNNPLKKLGCHRKWENIEIAGLLTGD